ncbi:TIGR01777 family oxidoreductase [Maribellus sp. YY47]|uniref:TIGR01777 family oxidoreductase n=1 Tax=Maribellus sp. YY47 TaxID=2929486 RepID=UPI002000EFD1|nr:TIGR01777 family oxidoreductase [Maribellus sp. YY47]MCK3685202.1 TIGR01777 family oxidoreductase [Maribellus sp. YY47]
MTISTQSKTIVITGQNGYLGSMLTSELRNAGYAVRGIPRSKLYDTNQLVDEIRSCFALINLAGAPVLQRWNSKNRKIIYESRIVSTRNLVQAINSLPIEDRPEKFISASAIGIYKTNAFHDEESSNFDEGFLGTVVKDWEKTLDDLPSQIQKVIFRIGLVLGKNAKTIHQLLLPFKLGLGASIGNGRQAFPFVHEADLMRAFVWAVTEYDKNNTFNLVAPDRITNKTFTHQLARQLNRPAFLTIPGWAINLVLGEASVLLTEAPEVSSEKIQAAGFRFNYPDITSALQEIIGH